MYSSSYKWTPLVSDNEGSMLPAGYYQRLQRFPIKFHQNYIIYLIYIFFLYKYWQNTKSDQNLLSFTCFTEVTNPMHRVKAIIAHKSTT